MSEFWKYFRDTLAWPLIHAPGPVTAIVQGVALAMDCVRDDIVYFRRQWFPALCEPELVADHGKSRGLVRHPKETADQFHTRVINAYRWHLLGGKTEGLPEILKFYGFDTLIIENVRRYQPSRWAEFQVGLKTPATQEEQEALLADLDTLIWLVNEYKPARSVLARLYTDSYNRVPTVWSESSAWSEGFWSMFSGVPYPDKSSDLIVSFGMQRSFQAEPYAPGDLVASFGASTRYGFLAPYLDRPIWGRSAWSDVYPCNHGFAMGSLFSILWGDRATTGRRWRGEWDARSWLDYTGFDRKLSPWRMGQRALSRSHNAYSEGNRLSDINVCYSRPTAVILDAPPVWGASRWSAEDSKMHLLVIDERYINTLGMAPQTVRPVPQPPVCMAALLSITSLLANPERGQAARHDVNTLQLAPHATMPPRSASQEIFTSQCVALNPNPAPPVGITHYHAPQWLGAWNEPGRTWTTPRKITALPVLFGQPCLRKHVSQASSLHYLFATAHDCRRP